MLINKYFNAYVMTVLLTNAMYSLLDLRQGVHLHLNTWRMVDDSQENNTL